MRFDPFKIKGAKGFRHQSYWDKIKFVFNALFGTFCEAAGFGAGVKRMGVLDYVLILPALAKLLDSSVSSIAIYLLSEILFFVPKFILSFICTAVISPIIAIYHFYLDEPGEKQNMEKDLAMLVDQDGIQLSDYPNLIRRLERDYRTGQLITRELTVGGTVVEKGHIFPSLIQQNQQGYSAFALLVEMNADSQDDDETPLYSQSLIN